MKSIITSILFILISLLYAHAQSNFGKIEIRKGFNHSYKYGDIYLGIYQLESILKKNEAAYKLLKPAKTNYSLANILTYIGVPAIIYPLGDKIFNSSNNRAFWPILGTGIGAMAISIPLRRKANKGADKAVELYNSTLGNYYNKQPIKIKLALTNHGVGVIWNY